MLADVDPEAAESIHPHNVKRVIRALEYHRETGGRISEHNQIQRSKEPVYNSAYFVLNRNRAEVYGRINRRVDIMLENGLVDEVRNLLADGVPMDCQAMQGLGYKETLDFLNGKLTLEQAAYAIKLNTRHFAKRQITWFKREKDAIWLDYGEYKSPYHMLDEMIKILREKGIW